MKFAELPLSTIKVNRDARQRRKIDIGGLKESIKLYGVLNPIIITSTHVLVAGERRLEACKALGLQTIPVRYFEDLPPAEAQIIELEENLKRSDLPWRDMVNAITRLHSMYTVKNPAHSQQDTAKILSLTPSFISMCLRIGKDLENSKISGAQTLQQAYNVLSRLDERKVGDALSGIMSAGSEVFAAAAAGKPLEPDSFDLDLARVSGLPDGLAPPLAKSAPTAPVPEQIILQENFLKWAPSWDGPKFNFIHCDFPYGINVFDGPQGAGVGNHNYSDQEDIYWSLLACFCEHLDKFMAYSAHLMFWFSMEHYTETLEFFRQNAPSLAVQTFPLVWVKSDNVGILPDARRGPRRVYETCLIASRDDRPIVKAVGNAYSAPTDKTFHPSTKPEPVLRHFMSMFVDESTRILDPTCGGGSSLRAAESLGASAMLGLEIDPTHCLNARAALRQFHHLRSFSK